MLDVGDRNVEDVVKLLRRSEEADDSLRIPAEGLVDLQCGLSVRLGEREVVLCRNEWSVRARGTYETGTNPEC